jgi:hypothetical protein
VLPDDEAEAVSSSRLHGKEAWYGVAELLHRPKERSHREGEREEMMIVGLTRILLGRKIKKNHMVDSAVINEQWKFKATMS